MKEMKKISELGLETIELEDQVLLVDDKSPRKYGDYYLLRNARGNGVHKVNKWTEARHALLSGKKSNPVGVVVASTKPLEGLPLLVIEDEVEAVVKGSKYYPLNESSNQIALGGYVRGYNEAKETYKFTEEDMIEFSIWRSITIFSESLTPIGQFEKWKSLTKKELWVEVEYFYHSSKEFYGDEADWVKCDESKYNSIHSEIPKCPLKVVPKITNNQIKLILK